MCLYPFWRATLTASLTSLGLDCQVPNPKMGILAPVLRVVVVLWKPTCQYFHHDVNASCACEMTHLLQAGDDILSKF